MRYLILPCCVLLIFCAASHTPVQPPLVINTDPTLLLMSQDGLYGYINPEGQTIIEPRFQNAFEFAEGMAAAREKGLFGYINPRGEWAIPPQFEFAEPFQEGVAVIYTNGKPYYIDRSGNTLFDHGFASLGTFKNGRALVITKNNRKGIIRKDGSLFLDTIYDNIDYLQDGYYKPSTREDSATGRVDATGVVDSSGHFTIPMGSYTYLQYYNNTYLQFREDSTTREDSLAFSGFIDLEGNVLFKRKFADHEWISGGLYEGLIEASLYDPAIKDQNKWNNVYKGYMDASGKVIIDNPNYKRVTPFSNGRAFAQIDRSYYLIDTTGSIIYDKAFNYAGSFSNGFCLVRGSETGDWGVIDTTGHYIIEPDFEFLSPLGQNYFYFSEWSPNSDCEECYGVSTLSGHIIIEPSLSALDRDGFKYGLLKCVLDGRLSFIDTSGKLIWQEKEAAITELQPMNIDFMNRGYFYASSNHKSRYTGHGVSQNLPQKIDKILQLPKKQLSVTVKTEAYDTLWENHLGYQVIVANTTRKKIEFNAQDSRLYMKVQAKNPRGVWQDIEYLPSSWCGNSYHSIYLKKKEYWELTTPVYEGDFETQLRIELEYPDPDDEPENPWERKNRKVYSNEYAGSVNLSQFWRKPGYSPSGIMDPYND